MVHSTLIELFSWAGGLLFALTFVRVAQVLSIFVAQKVIEVAAIMQATATDKADRIAETAGLTTVMYLYGRLKDMQRQRRVSAVSAALETPETQGGMIRFDSMFQPVSETAETKQKQTTIPPAVRKGMDWIQAHPEQAEMSARAAGEAAGCSAATVTRARKQLAQK